MFINLKTHKPHFIVNHDVNVTYSTHADKSGPLHTVTNAEFFGTHREATAEEVEDEYPEAVSDVKTDTAVFAARDAAERAEKAAERAEKAAERAEKAAVEAKEAANVAQEAAAKAPKPLTASETVTLQKEATETAPAKK